jgi:hypothetical protein
LCELNDPPIQPTNRQNRYDPTLKRSAVVPWLGSGQPAETVAAEPGMGGQNGRAPRAVTESSHGCHRIEIV